MTILNLTQHKATPEQLEAGVVDLPDTTQLVNLLTFTERPDWNELKTRSNRIAKLAGDFNKSSPIDACMIGGAPFLMPDLQKALHNNAFEVLYAFSKRVTIEKMDKDGNLIKTSIFKHEGFIIAV